MPPRRSTRVNEVVPTILIEPNPNILLLRRSWKWAAFCQFFHTFPDLFNISDVTVDDIESDLVETGTLVLPRIMTRLLVVLTQDRKTTIHNWENTLRRQYEKRAPDMPAPLAPPPAKPESRSATPSTRGTSPPPSSSGSAPAVSAQDDKASAPVSSLAVDMEQDQPSELTDDNVETRPQHWADLDFMEKLDCLHLLTEWQFQNVTRFRRTVKSDGENAEWRMEPIGYDTQMNAYWLIADYRLWIQRSPPGNNISRKRKRATATTNARSQSSRRTSSGPPKSTPSKLTKVTPAAKRLNTGQSSESEATPSRARAAKLKANAKLDIQAKELAQYHKSLNSRGTRLSARIRGQAEDDLGEWQAIPHDWLEPASNKSNAGRNTRSSGRATRQSSRGQSSSAVESDVESELTELSSEDEADEELAREHEPSDDENGGDGGRDDSPEVASEEPVVPADFVEWETIAVTLSEWEEMAERFKQSTQYREKALHKILITQVIPIVKEHLLEIAKKREAEDALIGRKRSSRLAGKEAQKEEARAEQERLAAASRETSRAQRAEARLQREELERLERENAREQRRLERERRQGEGNLQDSSEDESESVDVVSAQEASKAVPREALSAPAKESKRRAPAPRRVQTPTYPPLAPQAGAQSQFRALQLDCEVCRAQMILTHNPGFPLVMCGVCSRAQHVLCWNTFDAANGRQPRDWNHTQFACYRCQSPHPTVNHSAYADNNTGSPVAASSAMHGYSVPARGPLNHPYSSNSPANHQYRNMNPPPNQYTHPQASKAFLRLLGLTKLQMHQQAHFSTPDAMSGSQFIHPPSSTWSAETVRGPHHGSHSHMGHSTSHPQANAIYEDRNWSSFHHTVQPTAYVPTRSYPYHVQP